jgi:hypothetical protein
VSARGPPCKRQSTEPLTKPQPARGYAEFFGCLCDCECLPRFKHAASIEGT